MSTVAFIPVRGGSKSIKNKNIMPLAGKPLVYWTILACVESTSIEKIYVSTDSEEIKHVVEGFGLDEESHSGYYRYCESRLGFPTQQHKSLNAIWRSKVEVISRSPETASDTATSESALIEFCKNYEFDKVVFLQATSPLTTSDDIEGAIEKIEEEKADSLVSVVHRYQFLWNTDGKPMNYDPKNRPRRQDWNGYLIENGAFYINSRENILNSKCRISGEVTFWEMDQKTLFEVDEPEDWKIVEIFINKN